MTIRTDARDRELATVAAIASRTPWTLRVTPLGRTPSVFSALLSVAVETRDHGDDVEFQAFPRIDLVPRIVRQLGAHRSADPERVRRPGRVAPLLINALTDEDAQFSDDDLRRAMLEASPELTAALGACEDARLLERSVPGDDFPRARLLVLSCGDLGLWALWDTLNAREPWNIGKARVQCVDRERLTDLVGELVSDLAIPEPEPQDRS